MHERLAQLEMQLSRVSESRQDDLATIETCVKTTANCQKQAAELANQYIERHALHPSIITVDMLADMILHMSRQAETLVQNQDLNPSLNPLLRSIVDAAKIAESKRQQLDIISIRPEESDELDRDRHEIVTAATTNDNDKHRKIHKTVTAGLIYRGKILRRARVSVYRFSKEDIAARQDRRQECQLLDREREKNEEYNRNN